MSAAQHTDDRTFAPLTGTILETCRVVIVAGIAYGAVVAGLGGRLAMFLLRITSPSNVIGMQSDDDFEIGRFTLAGTYNLLTLGAAVGVIGVATYLLVACRLLGPAWFRHLTVGLASGAVVGSMLVHADGIDFTLLMPKWLAISLFVLLPGLFGLFIGPAVDAVRAHGSWTRRGALQWVLPLLLLACFPAITPVVGLILIFVCALMVLGSLEPVARLRAQTPVGVVVRGAWLTVAVVGLAALLTDIAHIT